MQKSISKGTLPHQRRTEHQLNHTLSHPFQMSTKYKKPPTNTFRVNATTLTQHITSPDYLRSIIDPNAQYQVIPSIPQTLSWGIDQLIDVAIELSRNKILDVALPFRKLETDSFAKYYFGRYIFVNCKLAGIRLASSSQKNDNQKYSSSSLFKWPQKTTIRVYLWEELKQSYRRHKVPFAQKEPLRVGDFILRLKNATLGLPFQSEIDQNKQLLKEYRKQGVTILSVLQDTCSWYMVNSVKLNSKNYKMESPKSSNIRISEKDMVIVYAGVRMVTFEFVYLTLAVVAHKDKCLKGSQSLMNDTWLAADCLLPQHVVKPRQYPYNLEEPQIHEITQEVPLSINVSNESSQSKVLGQRLVVDSAKNLTKNEILPLFRLIYAYKNINKGRKFTVPKSINTIFVLELQNLSKFTEKPIQNFIQVYQSKQQPAGCVIHPSITKMHIFQSLQSLIESSPRTPIYLYSDIQEEFFQLQQLATTRNNVFVCSQYVRLIADSGSSLSRFQEIKAMDEFVNQAMQFRIHHMQQLLKLARSQKYRLNVKCLVDAIAVQLKQKLRQCFVLTPFAEYIMSRSYEEIGKELEQAEHSMAVNKEGINEHRNQDNLRIVAETAPSQDKRQERIKFAQTLERAKLRKQAYLKTSYFTCHLCTAMLQKQFVLRCSQCKTITCFPCMEKVLKVKDNKDSKWFQNCISCNIKLCDCNKCKERNGSARPTDQNQNTQDKMFEENNYSCKHCQSSSERMKRITVLCSICNKSGGCWTCAKRRLQIQNGNVFKCDGCIQRQKQLEQQRQNELLVAQFRKQATYNSVHESQTSQKDIEKEKQKGKSSKSFSRDSSFMKYEKREYRFQRKQDARKRKQSRQKSREKKKRRQSSSSSSSSSSRSFSSSSSSSSGKSSSRSAKRQPKRQRRESPPRRGANLNIRYVKFNSLPQEPKHKQQKSSSFRNNFRQDRFGQRPAYKGVKPNFDRLESKRNQPTGETSSKGLWGGKPKASKWVDQGSNMENRDSMIDEGKEQVPEQNGAILPFFNAGSNPDQVFQY